MAGEFGAFIAQMRLEKDVKLRPIAEKLGVSVTYLSDIIKGRRNPPDIEGLEALAEAGNETRYLPICQGTLWMNLSQMRALHYGKQKINVLEMIFGKRSTR